MVGTFLCQPKTFDTKFSLESLEKDGWRSNNKLFFRNFGLEFGRAAGISSDLKKEESNQIRPQKMFPDL